ncbi:MAG: hybrid sensor histidine kinase/response regulator [Oligoflexales bacterium]
MGWTSSLRKLARANNDVLAPPDQRPEFYRIKTELLYRQSRTAWVAALINATFFFYLSRDVIDRSEGIVWYSFVVVHSLFRMLILGPLWNKKSRQGNMGEAQYILWHRIACSMILVSGLLWGMLGSTFFENGSVAIQALCLFLLGGMCSGAVVAYATSLTAVNAFLWPALLPLIVTLFTRGGELYWSMMAIVIFYLLSMVKLGQSLNKVVVRNILLGNQNKKLISEIEAQLQAVQRTKTLEIERDNAEAANKAKTEFLANASHEIRTPITSIFGYAQMLSRDNAIPAQVRKYIDALTRQSEHLIRLVNDLLELARLETAPDKTFFVTIPIRKEIESVIDLHAQEIKDKSLSLNILFDDSLPTYFTSDLQKFRQVLLNLLSNAIKYTDSGSITVSVEADEDFLHIRVADTGIGIEEETRKTLFEPFTRGQTAKVQSRTGSGLGLSVAAKIAQLLGGELKLERSVTGRGSTFVFSLPLSQQGAQPQNSEQPKQRNITRFQGRILVVEDTEDIRDLISIILTKAGGEISQATNGSEAVRSVQNQKFDLIFMDIKMPELDGHEAIKIMRNMGISSPVVALTAHASDEERSKCIRNGFTDFLCKPFHPQDLTAIALKHLHK